MACIIINVKKVSIVGYGATGYVWQATTSDIEGAKVIALKQSRASLQLKRPNIEYEACILRYLQGHPSIPEFYAYGRQEHFEFLALELLGSTIGELRQHSNSFSLGTVLKVANQMLSSLSYIHQLGIVHRDVKPNNILLSLDNPEQLKIVDFGLARRIDSSETRRTNGDDFYVGTLGWASINSHEGFQLTRRDDLESLAYILLALLRGALPWQPYENRHVFNSTRQVLEKKRNWTGSRLAVGFAPPFGKFLDYARGLLFDETPDYEGWIVTFQNLEKISGYDGHQPFDWTAQENPSPFPSTSSKPLKPPPDCPMEKGQLVYVQVLPRPTLEGFRPIAVDPSYWHEPELSNAPCLSMETIPGIIVETCVHYSGIPGVYVLPIRRGTPPDFMKNRTTKVIGDCCLKPDEDSIVLPDWPFDDTYCFAWPYPVKFAFSPDVVKHLPAHWKISTEIAENLYKKYDALVPYKIQSKFGLEQLECLPGGNEVFSRVLPLTPRTLQTSEGFHINWTAEKGWYDDLVKICNKIKSNQGYVWGLDGVSNGNELTDSYFAHTGWENRQRQERNCSLTFEETFEEVHELKHEIHKFRLVVE